MGEKCMVGSNIWQALRDAGIVIPDDVTRIVIDINIEDPVKIYYETFANQGAIDTIINEVSANLDKVTIEEATIEEATKPKPPENVESK